MVFKIDAETCVKIFANESHAETEGNVYKKINGSPIIPKLYGIGSNYIVMEYIDGSNLKEYLIDQGKISLEDTREILLMFKEMKNLGFKRLDESLRHILITKDKKLKIVDLFYAYALNDFFPVKFFKQLEEINCLYDFLQQAKVLDLGTFLHWKKGIPQYFI